MNNVVKIVVIQAGVICRGPMFFCDAHLYGMVSEDIPGLAVEQGETAG